MINKKILFMGRSKCEISKKIILFLKKTFNKVDIFTSKNILTKPNKKILSWRGDYIFCFRSFFILKKNFIKKAKFAAINFHPGPPKYRGIGCVNFAILNNERKYGSTAHLIDENIDHGKIINVRYFSIKKNDGVENILNKTYHHQYLQFINIVGQLAKSDLSLQRFIKSSKKEKWSQKLYKRKDLNKLYDINVRTSKKMLDLILRATITKKYKPYIKIFKKKFFYCAQ